MKPVTQAELDAVMNRKLTPSKALLTLPNGLEVVYKKDKPDSLVRRCIQARLPVQEAVALLKELFPEPDDSVEIHTGPYHPYDACFSVIAGPGCHRTHSYSPKEEGYAYLAEISRLSRFMRRWESLRLGLAERMNLDRYVTVPLYSEPGERLVRAAMEYFSVPRHELAVHHENSFGYLVGEGSIRAPEWYRLGEHKK